MTWQILGLALHSDRPVGGVWTLFYTRTQLPENNSQWLCRFYSDRRGGWLLQRLGDGIGHSLTRLGNWTQQCVVRRQLSAITVGLFCALERFTPFNRLFKVPSLANIIPEKSIDEVSRYNFNMSWDHQWGREYSCSRDTSSRFTSFQPFRLLLKLMLSFKAHISMLTCKALCRGIYFSELFC